MLNLIIKAVVPIILKGATKALGKAVIMGSEELCKRSDNKIDDKIVSEIKKALDPELVKKNRKK